MKKFVFMFFFFSAAYASPIDPVIINGSANFINDENSLKVVSSENLILHWKSFSIDKIEKVSFVQPSKNSFVLNRVVGIDKSIILGDLLSNGNVFLLNPNGILVGKDATIDVSSFIASTLNLKDQDFLNNDSLNFLGDSKESIINLGSIKASKDVYLISRSIENQGSIDANGKVLLGASNSILIKPNEKTSLYILSDINKDSKEKIGLALSGSIKSSQIEIKANGNLYDLAINLKGNIDATSITEENGEIYLKADFGDINISDANISASKKSSGGRVEILADEININGNTKIDVSHGQDGGNVYIGGHKQGKDSTIISATSVIVGSDVVIDASSKVIGNGGEIITWSDDKAHFYGKIFANGGKNSGNGGFAEVSGLKDFIYEGVADLRASYGELGTLLLDPTDITVGSNAGDTNITYSINDPVLGTNTAAATVAVPNTAIVGIDNLNTNLSTANVVISTQSAGVAPPLGGAITVNLTAGSISSTLGNLTLRATSNILFATSAANSINFSNTTASFTAIAGDPSIGGSDGDIQFNGTTFTLNFPASSTGSASFTANGTGIVTTAAAAAIKTITFNNVPTINFSGNSGITIANNLVTNATNVNFGNASIVTLSANGPIIFGNNGAGLTRLQASSSTVLNVNAFGGTGTITFAKGAASAANALFFTNFSSINFNAGSTITTTPPALQTITFENVPTINLSAIGEIRIGNNVSGNAVNINFPNTSVFNITTTDPTSDIILGSTAAGSGSTTFTGNASAILTFNAGRDILIQGGTGGYNFTTLSSLSFTAGNSITYNPNGTFVTSFSSVGSLEYLCPNTITIGQNSTTFTTTLNFANTNLINISTTGVSQDIILGGTGTGAFTVNGSSSTTLNVNPTGAVNFLGASGISAFNLFNTINIYSATVVPTSFNLINFSRSTITFNGIPNLMMYPYNLIVDPANTVTNILSSTNLALIKTIDPSGTTIPATLQINTNFSNFDFQTENLTINGRILNANEGYIYLTSENDILIEATSAAARVGVITGDVKVNCSNDLTVKGGNASGFFAQIGQQTSATVSVNSDIYLDVGRDVNILGGSAIATGNDYACIGHGSKTPANPCNIQGDIIIESIGRRVNITAGGTLATPAFEGAARLGHGVLDVSAAGALVNISGDIRGVTPGSRGIVTDHIHITGGVGEQSSALLGHTVSTMSSGTATINGNILLQCGELEMITQPATALFEMYAGVGHKVRFIASGLSATINGSVDVVALGNSSMTANGFGGAILFGAYINNSGAFTSTGDIDFSLVNLEVAGSLTILGGTTAGPQENKVIIGVYSDFVANYTRSNFNLRTGVELSLVSRTGDSCFFINGQTPTLGRTMDINAGNNFYLWGQNKSASVRAIDTLNISAGRDFFVSNSSGLATDYTSIESENTLNLFAGNDLFVSGFGINVNPFADPGFAVIRNNSLVNGDMNLIVNEDITLNPFVKIENRALGKTLAVVCDNQNPVPFKKGDIGISISTFNLMMTNSGPLRIYSVDQSLNDILDAGPVASPKFNGVQFIQGEQFVDTATEVWGVYYPSAIGGVPFTFLYKNSQFSPFPSVFPSVNAILQENNNFFIPFFEIFYRPYVRFFDITFEKCSEKKESVCFY